MKLMLASVWVVGFAGLACAQSVPTPGAPSIPFTPAAQALNGGAGPQVTYQYGIEFVTIGNSGNAPYTNPDWGPDIPSVGAGGTNYEFRMGRYEVTNAQWAQFYDAVNQVAASTGSPIPYVQNPSFSHFTVSGGHVTSAPGHEMDPVGGISWRTAAIYCNWLCAGQALTRDAFMSGAYDVSSFGYVQGNHFTDQPEHTPGAAFWIPTVSEIVHATYYDPNRYGPGQGGYWNYNITSDTAPVYRAPGTIVGGRATQANSQWLGPGSTPGPPFSTPLGSYPTVQSPYGLLDSAGGTSEWSEGFVEAPGGYRQRYFHGSSAAAQANEDSIDGWPSDLPSFAGYVNGLRIAASIPAPSMWISMLSVGSAYALRRPLRR